MIDSQCAEALIIGSHINNRILIYHMRYRRITGHIPDTVSKSQRNITITGISFPSKYRILFHQQINNAIGSRFHIAFDEIFTAAGNSSTAVQIRRNRPSLGI